MTEPSKLSDDVFADRVIELASSAIKRGESPFSTLIVKEGQILAEEINRTCSEGNPTLHAEIVAIAAACKSSGQDSLVGATAYCSCEPCVMCLMALYYAGIVRVVYSATIYDAIEFGSGDPEVTAQAVVELGNLKMSISQGSGRTKAVALFERKEKRDGVL